MQLSELFVSHKQVDPIKFDFVEPELPTAIYINADRARKITSDEVSAPEAPTASTPTKPVSTPWIVSETFTRKPDSKVEIPVSSNDKWINPYKDKNTWVADMTAAYKKAGLGDNAIRNLIAKNALESGWGKSAQGDFNFGNITTGSSWKGRFVQGNDHNASGQKISQKFRAYNSLNDFVNDEIQFLTRLYDFNKNDDFDTFINKLQGNNKGKRKYAEDLRYIDKVRGVYNSI